MGKGGRSGRIVNDFGPAGHKGAKKASGTAKAKSGVKNLRNKAEAPAEIDADVPLDAVVPLKLQQLTLDIFKDTFAELLGSVTLQALLQEVKAALYDRDFHRAFGRKDYLEAYSARWSPSRALCYQSLLVDLRQHLAGLFSHCQPGQPGAGITLESTLQVVALGGGAAEVVAFAGFLRYLNDVPPPQATSDADINLEDLSITDAVKREISSGKSVTARKQDIEIILIDSAPWQDVCSRLSNGLTTPPPLSKYANAIARQSHCSLISPESFKSTSLVENILHMDQAQLDSLFGTQPVLCSLLFTLNELYTASISKTTTFLLNLTTAVKSGTLLLVVDSPGSYSEAQVGLEAKRYPMKWLLDHTLLDAKQSKGSQETFWAKIMSDDSRWFRIPESLRYPIPLENMRYQLHLYRRI
ncbi:hypothetical protein BUE80_DR008681 [Diplocarpon rosae]|nr:hypothetical protein BUE80_DR008681 [Diplocarpon rosae]